MPFYGKIMKGNRIFHILRFLHFSDNRNKPDKGDESYYRLWKLGTIFDKLSDSYAKYYSPTEHLEVDEIIVIFRGRIIFKQYIPKKHKRFGIKICRLCDPPKGYTYDMRMYLGKDRKYVTATVTATHVTVTGLISRIKNIGLFFSSPELFYDLHSKIINCCGTSPPHPEWLWGPPRLLSNGYQGLFPWG
jgi:hypothetical protein